MKAPIKKEKKKKQMAGNEERRALYTGLHRSLFGEMRDRLGLSVGEIHSESFSKASFSS